MKSNFLELKQDLFIIKQKIVRDDQEKIPKKINTHHLFIIDCSGSMYDELPKIRKELYNKISTDMLIDDSLTIIWFSGKKECGIVLEDYHIKSNLSLLKVKESIERYLVPSGLTAFKDPFELAKTTIQRINDKNFVHSLFFITDGNDNQYSQDDIINAVNNIKDDLSNATIVEYGWYCNKELLSKIACTLSGVHIFSEHFQEYEPFLKKEFCESNFVKRKLIKLDDNIVTDNIFSITKDGQVINYLPNDNNEILINEDNECFFYFSNTPVGEEIKIDINNAVNKNLNFSEEQESILSALYASLFSFSRINDYNKVSDVLKFIGDAYFIVKKTNTFGNQKINELENEFLKAVNDKSFRFLNGYNPELEPKEDDYSVIDMIDDLMEFDDNLWYPLNKDFTYNRIGAKAVIKEEMSQKDKEELKQLLEEGQIKDIKEKIKEVSEKKEIKFEYDNKEQGYPISELVWNEKRANLSVQVTYLGQVELPENKFDKLPKIFKTKKFRNYTLIKDGVINTYVLPVSLCKITFDKLQKNGLLLNEVFEDGKIYKLNFSMLPVVNRKMINSMSAEELFRDEYRLLKIKAKNTIFNYYKKKIIGKVSYDFLEKFGEDATNWLKEIGITSNGFNPETTLEKTGEEIFVNSLKIKIDKLSLITLESDINKILEKYKNKEPLTNRESLLIPAIEEVENFIALFDDINANNAIENWINEKLKIIKREKTKLMNQISKTKFLCIVGKSWFKEFKSRDEKEMILKIDDNEIKFSLDDKMEKVKL